MLLTVLFACATTPAPEPAGAPEPEPATETPAPAEETLQELHRLDVGDATAVFLGEPVPDGMSPSFGVRELVFVLADGTQAPFRPTGSVEFSDWTLDILSPDGAHLLLVQDHYGPYHVVPVTELVPYLAGKTGPAHEVRQAQAADMGAWVHEGGRWTSPTEVTYEAGLTTMETFTYSLAD